MRGAKSGVITTVYRGGQPFTKGQASAAGIPDLFSSHGLEHLLQLDAQLLDVVEEDAGLGKTAQGCQISGPQPSGLCSEPGTAARWLRLQLPLLRVALGDRVCLNGYTDDRQQEAEEVPL